MVYKFFKKGNFYMHCYTFGEFAAHSENVLVDPNVKHEETSILEGYKGKLKVDGDVFLILWRWKQVGLVKKTVFQNGPQYFIMILRPI